MVGQRLAHYEILEKIGEGGMGVVFKARDPRLGRFVALKVLSADKLTDADRKLRFIREARAASALNHPSIVTIHDIASDQGNDFIVMEFVSGATLERLIGNRGVAVSESLRIGSQVAEALNAAHKAGILHRDLKPGNIMASDSGLVKRPGLRPCKAHREASSRGR
jgi:serine/threonine-protein kinase